MKLRKNGSTAGNFPVLSIFMLTGVVPAKWLRRYLKILLMNIKEKYSSIKLMFVPVGSEPGIAAGALPKQAFVEHIQNILHIN